MREPAKKKIKKLISAAAVGSFTIYLKIKKYTIRDKNYV